MAITDDDSTLYVAALGSSKVGVYKTSELETNSFVPSTTNRIHVTGGGPMGLVLDDQNHRLYVLTRFDHAISIIDTQRGAEAGHVPMHLLHQPLACLAPQLLEPNLLEVLARAAHYPHRPSDEGSDDDTEPARTDQSRPDALARRPHRRQRRAECTAGLYAHVWSSDTQARQVMVVTQRYRRMIGDFDVPARESCNNDFALNKEYMVYLIDCAATGSTDPM